MSQPEQNEDETQLESQAEQMQDVETQELEEPGNFEEEDEVVAALPKRKKPQKKEVVMREPGKTLLPMSRVQKIIKADKVHSNASFI
jgi:DNA polymerase epsilon subunit 4